MQIFNVRSNTTARHKN